MAPACVRTAGAFAVLLAGLAVSALATEYDCTTGCRADVATVCGQDNQSYANECMAVCNGVEVAHEGYCEGNTLGLEFAAISNTRTGSTIAAAKESAVINPTVSAEAFSRFVNENFKLVGQVALAQRPLSMPAPWGVPAVCNETEAPARLEAGDTVKAYRVTRSGHVYVKQFTYQPGGAPELAPIIPEGQSLPKALPRNARSLLGAKAIIGADGREACPRQQYPYTAIGQIDFSIGNAQYICSGALIRRNKVLTAAHCVFDQESRGFTNGISFAPGRYVDGNGAVVNPVGTFPWSYSDLFAAWKGSQEQRLDIALITLDAPAPSSLGLLGLKATCPNGPVPITIGGYPADKPLGTCMESSCSLSWACNADSGQHTCDTSFGMSGSAVWDRDGFIRGVHVRGMSSFNEATVIGQAVLDQVSQWAS